MRRAWFDNIPENIEITRVAGCRRRVAGPPASEPGNGRDDVSIDWQEDLATGIESIDNQHKEIFARFTLFSEACSEGFAGDELLNLVEFLAEYTVEHFRDEEKIMAGAEYPQLAEQEKAHAAFLDDFGLLRQLVEENGPSLENILNEKRSMIRWLINHICHMDRKFADFITTARRQPPTPHTA